MSDPSVVDPCLWTSDSISLSVAEDNVSLRADLLVDPDPANAAEVIPGAGVFVQGAPWVTTFPTGVDDGYMVRFRPGNGQVVWRFVWSGDLGLWLFDGGPPLSDRVTTSELRSGSGGGSGYNDLATVGPTVSFPRAMGRVIFMARFGCRIANGSPAGAGGIMSLRYFPGPANPSDTDGAYYSGVAVSSVSQSLRNRSIDTSVWTDVVAKYATVGADSITFANRWLEVEPVSCTGGG